MKIATPALVLPVLAVVCFLVAAVIYAATDTGAWWMVAVLAGAAALMVAVTLGRPRTGRPRP